MRAARYREYTHGVAYARAVSHMRMRDIKDARERDAASVTMMMLRHVAAICLRPHRLDAVTPSPYYAAFEYFILIRRLPICHGYHSFAAAAHASRRYAAFILQLMRHAVAMLMATIEQE